MPRSPTGRYCESPPRSPRHYDKYTYAARRRPEGLEESVPRTPTRAPHPRGSAYEACVAGVAPLMNNVDGFAVAEDGTVQSRFVSAPRHSAPSIAMVPVPMAVMPVEEARSGGHRILMSPPKKEGDVAPVPYQLGVSEIVPSGEVEAWKRLVMVAGRDFREEELVQLNWETLSELLTHYKMNNPVDIARIQLQWKRKQGMLPSDSVEPRPVEVEGTTYVPTYVRYPTAASPSRPSFRGTVPETSSPRRDSPRRYVPSYKQRMSYDHVSPKVNTGRRTPSRGRPSPARTQTPTRRL